METASGTCDPLLYSPAEIGLQQLDELGLRVTGKPQR